MGWDRQRDLRNQGRNDTHRKVNLTTVEYFYRLAS